MAKIVIDVDDKTYKAFMELISINLGRSNKGIIEKCLNAIKHGRVLPKGHGRLIDADKMLDEMRATRTYDILFALERVKPIIEADKN